MKRLSDLTTYKGVLPYASEIFGIYQPLLGWKSARNHRRVQAAARTRTNDLVRRISRGLVPQVTASFVPRDGGVDVRELAPARTVERPHFAGTLVSQIAAGLPPRKEHTPRDWDRLLATKNLTKMLSDHVVPEAKATYRALAFDTNQQTGTSTHIQGESAAREMLMKESSVAGALAVLREKGQYNLLDALFYGRRDAAQELFAALQVADDPFATIDPTSQLDRVGLSPVGIAHLFREFFFELDTFLGSPTGHVWLSPGSTVELIEVHTRRELVEQTLEQSIEGSHKTEKSLTQQDELSDAVKQDNQTDMKLGVSVSANERWGWGSANESASFGLENTEKHAREQTHKTMRQQSEKLSSEIKQSFKTTFRTVTETTDMSTKRYVLANETDHLINYELRRKMRQVAVQVQDIGSYLCWQTYVDNPGADIGVSRLVHIGAPPDLTALPQPKTVAPLTPFSEDKPISLPFVNLDDADNDEDYDHGNEADAGGADAENHIQWIFPIGPLRCSQAGFRLQSVTMSPEGADAVLSTDQPKADPDHPGDWGFHLNLEHVNFQEQDSINVKATLNWAPTDDAAAAIEKANQAAVNAFTAEERAAFEKAFVDEARERIKLASNIVPRPADDLREEERIAVYRALIQDLLAPSSIIPQPDPKTQHIVAELLDSIFDVDKLLYFVAPEWWRPRLHHTHQELVGSEGAVDPVTGEYLAVTPSIAEDDFIAWGEGDLREDNYFITEDSAVARLGSSLGWLLQLDGDDLRNAFLNAPWVKAVLPIRPGRERAALNWLRHVEGMNGIGPSDMYEGPEPEWKGKKTVIQVLELLADRVSAKHEAELTTNPNTLDDGSTIYATPVDLVFETGFDPLAKGFRSEVGNDFEVFDQWIEVLPTDQVAVVEVTYDPKTGRQI
jgi:hypothetical protein